ncbi:MAG: VanZ family protein [Acidobacteriota bacterium]|nr:VanZ family protein [Acidobacteriota bacterium]
MAAIFSFSTDTFSGENTGSLFFDIFHTVIPSLTPDQFRPIHFLIRKAAHFTVYGILALLLFRAFRGNSRLRWAWSWAIYAWLILAAYALSDEFHQSLTHHRTSSIYDSLIDTSGGTVALLLVWLISRFRQDQLSPCSTRSD